MLSSHHILFQAPAVISENIYIPLAFVVVLHNVNVLVKVLTLLFLQISTVLSKIVQVRLQKMKFDWQSYPNLMKTLLLLFNFFLVFCIPAVSQEVCNYWLQWLPGGQLNFAQCFVKHLVLMSFLIWGPPNIPPLNFPMLICWNFWRKANPLPSLSIAFTKFFITPNLICKGGSSIFSVQREGET